MAPDQPDTAYRQMGIVINPSNASMKETAIAIFRIMRTVAVPKKLVNCIVPAQLCLVAEMSPCGRIAWLCYGRNVCVWPKSLVMARLD